MSSPPTRVDAAVAAFELAPPHAARSVQSPGAEDAMHDRTGRAGRRGGALWLTAGAVAIGIAAEGVYTATFGLLFVPFELVALFATILVAALATAIRRRAPPRTSAFGRAAWLVLLYRTLWILAGPVLLVVGKALDSNAWYFFGVILMMPSLRLAVLDLTIVAFGMVGAVTGRSFWARAAGIGPALLGAAVGALDLSGLLVLTMFQGC